MSDVPTAPCSPGDPSDAVCCSKVNPDASYTGEDALQLQFIQVGPSGRKSFWRKIVQSGPLCPDHNGPIHLFGSIKTFDAPVCPEGVSLISL